MPDNEAQSDERVKKQNQIDEAFVEPLWARYVDIPLLEMCCASNMPIHPVILMPELRLKSLLKNLISCLPGKGKIMIVDNVNARFESLRQSVSSSTINLYFSTQEMSALNYADNSFHFALTELGIASICRADVNFASYKRVLKPNSHIIWSAPQKGTFPAFFDILEECLYTIDSRDCKEIMSHINTAMDVDATKDLLSLLGYAYEGGDSVSFDLMFPGPEQLLFSTLVESHFLSYCLSLNYTNIDGKALLTTLIRAFNQYFQGESITVPMKIGVHSARKL